MLNFVLVSAKILKMEYPPLIKQFALKVNIFNKFIEKSKKKIY